MDLDEGFINERTPAVLDTLLGTLASVDEVLTSDASRASYRGWVASLLKPAMAEMGWTPRAGETEEQKEVRAALVGALGETARDRETIQTAHRLMQAHLDSNQPIDPTLLNRIVGAAAISGDASLYDRYVARSKQASDPEEHYRYLYALAHFGDPAL